MDLVIDHSVVVDSFGTPMAARQNAAIEFERNQERYRFLRWGAEAFSRFRVVPPATGIVHQVNLELLAKVVMEDGEGDERVLLPDTLVGNRFPHHHDQRPRESWVGASAASRPRRPCSASRAT